MVCKGDVTSHGGLVLEGASTLRHMGIPVALDGHLVFCPKCGGEYPIIASGTRRHGGLRIAKFGDETACGAKLIRA
ncbi:MULTISPECIES: PAAR domain-containing protein [Pandoraea]|uniref:PAAR domain-containing protein n=1 Tax=Pandoraea TaxID=93217 RepID=UPI00123F31D8|nr:MULTISPECIES: PAAR domain-containing protein [Pandoraea]